MIPEEVKHTFDCTEVHHHPSVCTFIIIAFQSSNAEEYPFTEEELKELTGLFHEHDKNLNGSVDRAELIQLIKSLEEKATSEEVEAAIASFDTDNDGALNLEEFMSLMAGLRRLEDE